MRFHRSLKIPRQFEVPNHWLNEPCLMILMVEMLDQLWFQVQLILRASVVREGKVQFTTDALRILAKGDSITSPEDASSLKSHHAMNPQN